MGILDSVIASVVNGLLKAKQQQAPAAAPRGEQSLEQKIETYGAAVAVGLLAAVDRVEAERALGAFYRSALRVIQSSSSGAVRRTDAPASVGISRPSVFGAEVSAVVAACAGCGGEPNVEEIGGILLCGVCRAKMGYEDARGGPRPKPRHCAAETCKREATSTDVCKCVCSTCFDYNLEHVGRPAKSPPENVDDRVTQSDTEHPGQLEVRSFDDAGQVQSVKILCRACSRGEEPIPATSRCESCRSNFGERRDVRAWLANRKTEESSGTAP